jgi:hypothetical protein
MAPGRTNSVKIVLAIVLLSWLLCRCKCFLRWTGRVRKLRYVCCPDRQLTSGTRTVRCSLCHLSAILIYRESIAGLHVCRERPTIRFFVLYRKCIHRQMYVCWQKSLLTGFIFQEITYRRFLYIHYVFIFKYWFIDG